MYELPFAQISLLNESNKTTNNKTFCIINPSHPTIFSNYDYTHILDDTKFNELIFFANNVHLHYKPWPYMLNYDLKQTKEDVLEQIKSTFNAIALGYKKHLKSKDIKQVVLYYPLITYSERLLHFDITYFYEIETNDNKTIFNILHKVPSFESIRELNNYINTVFFNATKNIAASNNCYNFTTFAEGKVCNSVLEISGYDTRFSFASFIKSNFGINMDETDKNKFCTLSCLGELHPYNHKAYSIAENYTLYSSIEKNQLTITIDSFSWRYELNYTSYSKICIENMCYYSHMLYLYNDYTKLFYKNKKTENDNLKLKILKDSLKPLLKTNMVLDKTIKASLIPKVNHEILATYFSKTIAEFTKINL